MGIGSAISVTLYKPLFEGDRHTVREIVALQGWLYRRVAGFLLFGSAVLFCFFPLIFSKMELPLWYAYASFGALTYSFLLGYFVNYKQVLLSADQQDYKVQLCIKLVMTVKLVVQAFCIRYLANGYYWWLGLEIVFATISSIVLNMVINRSFPFIREKFDNPGLMKDKYPDVVRKVRQLFVHRIGGYVLNQTSPLIIYAFASLSLVAYYGNYTLLTLNLGYLITAIFSGMGGSVGNMVAEGNKQLIIKVFRELFSIRFLMISVSSICLLLLTEPFITVWIGKDYLLDRTTLILVIAIFMTTNIRNTVDTFISSYGLFWDIWAPIAEAVLNIGCSIALGYCFGLPGILSGVVISQVLVVMTWKPILLYRYGFKEPVKSYFIMLFKQLMLMAAAALIVFFISTHTGIDATSGYLSFFGQAVIVGLSSLIVMGVFLYASEQGMRTLTERMYKVICRK